MDLFTPHGDCLVPVVDHASRNHGCRIFFFPKLRADVTLPWYAPDDIWLGLFVQSVLVLLWIVHEFWYTAHRLTSVAQLQADVVGDITVVVVLSSICAGMIAKGGVPWWFIVPLFGAILDVYQAAIFSINNAAEKPFLGRGSP